MSYKLISFCFLERFFVKVILAKLIGAQDARPWRFTTRPPESEYLERKLTSPFLLKLDKTKYLKVKKGQSII